MQQFRFQDSASLVNWLKYGMVIWMVIIILMLLTEFVYSSVIYEGLDTGYGGVAVRMGRPKIWEVMVMNIFPVAKFLVSLIWYLFLVMWIFRCQANNWALGLPRLVYPPSMSVAWFFIPLANLFMPFMVLTEMFKASDPGADTPQSSMTWEHSGAPSMLGTWWVGMILVAPLAFVPFISSYLFSGFGAIGMRMVELVVFTLMCTLMFMIWREAKELRERQNRKFSLMFPHATHILHPEDHA